jgi:D-amino-acid dehydrogenase
VPGVPNVLYAFGHQHIGLTLSAVTARTVADLFANQPLPAHLAAFDLRRFN